MNRVPDTAITDADLAGLTISGLELWGAFNAHWPEISLVHRNKVINYLVNQQVRGKPQILTAREFHNVGLRPKEPIHILDQDVQGVVTDTTQSAGGMLYFSIDGKIASVHPQTKIAVWGTKPDVKVETVVDTTALHEAQAAIDRYTESVLAAQGVTVRINAENLWRNQDTWKGKTVKVENEGPAFEGIFTDAAKLSSSGNVTLVLDARLATVAKTQYVIIKGVMEPPKEYVHDEPSCGHRQSDPNWICLLPKRHGSSVVGSKHAWVYRPDLNPYEMTITARELSADRERYEGRKIEYARKAGVFTDIAWIGANNVYQMVLDGKIYGTRPDQELKVLKD